MWEDLVSARTRERELHNSLPGIPPKRWLMNANHQRHGHNWGRHASKIMCSCKEGGSRQPLRWRGATRSPGLAGRQGQSPALWMLGVPGAAGLPASAWFRSLPWKWEMKDTSFHLNFYLTFWSKGLGVPLVLEVFFSCCPLSIKAKISIFQVNPKSQRRGKVPAAEGLQGTKIHLVMSPGRLENHCLYGVELHSGHSSEMSHSRDWEHQPALPTKQQLKPTQ